MSDVTRRLGCLLSVRILYRGLKKIVKVWETAKETEGAEQTLF